MQKTGIHRVLDSMNQRYEFVALVMLALPFLQLYTFIPTDLIAAAVVSFCILNLNPRKAQSILGAYLLAKLAVIALYDVPFLELAWVGVTALTTHVLYYTRSFGLMTEVMTLMGVMVIMILYAFFPEVQAYWIGLVEQLPKEHLEQMSLNLETDPAMVKVQLIELARFMTGMSVATQIVGALCATYVGLMLDAIASQRPERLLQCQQTQASQMSLLLLTTLGAAAYFTGSYVVIEMFIPTLIPFFIAGFMWINAEIRRQTVMPKGVAQAIFILMLVLIPPVFSLFIIAGVCRSILQLSDKLLARTIMRKKL